MVDRERSKSIRRCILGKLQPFFFFFSKRLQSEACLILPHLCVGVATVCSSPSSHYRVTAASLNCFGAFHFGFLGCRTVTQWITASEVLSRCFFFLVMELIEVERLMLFQMWSTGVCRCLSEHWAIPSCKRVKWPHQFAEWGAPSGECSSAIFQGQMKDMLFFFSSPLLLVKGDRTRQTLWADQPQSWTVLQSRCVEGRRPPMCGSQ